MGGGGGGGVVLKGVFQKFVFVFISYLHLCIEKVENVCPTEGGRPTPHALRTGNYNAFGYSLCVFSGFRAIPIVCLSQMRYMSTQVKSFTIHEVTKATEVGSAHGIKLCNHDANKHEEFQA